MDAWPWSMEITAGTWCGYDSGSGSDSGSGVFFSDFLCFCLACRTLLWLGLDLGRARACACGFWLFTRFGLGFGFGSELGLCLRYTFWYDSSLFRFGLWMGRREFSQGQHNDVRHLLIPSDLSGAEAEVVFVSIYLGVEIATGVVVVVSCWL